MRRSLFNLHINPEVDYSSNASLTFHTFHTFPTRSGLGLRAFLPGFQPEGMASMPFEARTCWKAMTCLMVSLTFLPTGGVRTSNP